MESSLNAGEVTSETVEAAAQGGDAVGFGLWADIVQQLGVAIANAITLFNPEVLVLGGGVWRALLHSEEGLGAQIKAHAGRRSNSKACASQEARWGTMRGLSVLLCCPPGRLLRRSAVHLLLQANALLPCFVRFGTKGFRIVF